MALRFTKLRLQGFKSFVEPTTLEILPGLTGIVGPNGCGKSNIVEAVRWVMGETSARSLRGAEMDDVIFAGSAARPQRGAAEVTLFLEAPPGEAPAALAAEVGADGGVEIEISRRIERGYGSSYRVNGREWRARDVQLLFADNATGARSAALVSQGKVATLVNARPEDRRTLLEEAAGITGLHARRHEAEMKLRAAEANLARVDDLLGTLDRQLQTLRKQARQATRYRSISAQLRETEEALHAARLARSAAAEVEAAAAQREAERKLAEAAEVAAQTAARAAEAEAVLPALREADAEARTAIERARADASRLESEEASAARAVAAAEAELHRVAEDLAHAQRLASDAAGAEARLAEEAARLMPLHEAAPARIAEAEAEIAETHERVTVLELAAQAATQRAAAIAAEAQALSGQISAAEQALAKLAREAARLAAERIALERQMVEAAALDRAEATRAEAEAELAAASAEVEAAESARAAANAATAEAAKAAQAAEADCTRLAAEAAALNEVLAVRGGDLGTPLVDAITVPEGLETALGAALGEALEAPADEDAPRHWQTLPPLLPIQPLPPGAIPLATLVAAPPALRRALSQVGLVRNDTEGARLAVSLRPGQILVDRDGAVWRWDGYVVKAGTPTAAATRLAHRNRLTAVKERLALAEMQLREARAVQERAAAAEARAIAREQTARRARAEAERALESARRDVMSLTARATTASSRLAALALQEKRLAADRAEAEAALAALRKAQAALPPLREAEAAQAEARLALAEARRAESEARAALEVARRDCASIAARLSAIADERRAWAARAAEAEARVAELFSRRDEAETRRRCLADQLDRLVEQRSAAFDALGVAEAKRRDTADALAVAEREAALAIRKAREAEGIHLARREALVRAEEALKQALAARHELAKQVFERLNVEAEVIASRFPHAASYVDAEQAAARQLERLLRERDAIGPVNLAAETEMAEVEARIASLSAEREDLAGAIAKLRAAIGALNREGRERLVTRFAEVDRHFQELFARLFGGGSAHLKLVDNDDPLEAGLEIMAQPPGKKLTSLSLLSGGEQALTALSLIFAVFLANPAPICVLDEVDAPLDDANVDRFCALLGEIARMAKTRFLVVTHNRLTMARMDRLYGVTMAERGVSQLVSVDLATAEAMAPRAIAAE